MEHFICSAEWLLHADNPIFIIDSAPPLTRSTVFSFLRLRHFLLLAIVVPCLLSSCATGRYYQQRTMFQLTKGADGVVDTAKLRRAVNRTARNYLIQANDYLNVQVFTNGGERLIDPNGELKFGTPGTGASVGQSAGAVRSPTTYLVQADGTVRLPLVNRVPLKGLSLIQADSVLQKRYNDFYKESFVKTSVSNNRVIVLGASGGQVIPLNNDNMNLLEVLALSGGVDATNSGGAGGFSQYGGRVNNIRIIRGDLKNPQVQFIDLSTIEGMRRGNLQVEPNDIIYVQPVRRPFIEGLTSLNPIITITSTLFSVLGFIIAISR